MKNSKIPMSANPNSFCSKSSIEVCILISVEYLSDKMIILKLGRMQQQINKIEDVYKNNSLSL